MKKIMKYSLFLSTIITSSLWSFGIGRYEWFPYEYLQYLKSNLIYNSSGEFDDLHRLINLSSKRQVSCPVQSERTGVILAFGQSNSANDAEYLYNSNELKGVYNYFDGKCFYAESPLLGATGKRGEWISKTARNLIDLGTYDEVIVVSTGIGASPIVRWAEGNDLNMLLENILRRMKVDYKLTDVVWHQGESDANYTHTQTYVDLFKTIKNTFRKVDVDAPIFVSVASLCGSRKNYPNRITIAQNKLAQEDGIHIGVNTDELVKADMRYDGCHFSKEGQELAAKNLSTIIANYHKRHE